MIDTILKLIRKHWLFGVICILLLIVPFFWFNNHLYLLGEDDTGISYYNPFGTLQTFSTVWFSQDSLASLNPGNGGETIFDLILVALKTITFGKINLQLFAFSFILSLSFTFIVKILELYTERQSNGFYIAGLFYTLSSYFVMVEYYYLLPSSFIIVLGPALAFYLLKAVKTKTITPLFVAAIWSFLLSRSLTSPVFINFYSFLFIFIVSYSYYCFEKNRIKYAIAAYFKLTLFIFMINAIVMIPTIYSVVSKNNNAITTAIKDRTGSNAQLMVNNLKTEMGINKNHYFLMNLFPKQISAAQGFRDFPLYYKYLDNVSFLSYLIVLLAIIGVIVASKADKKLVTPIIVLLVFVFMLLTVDISSLFEKFYIYLLVHTPIFNMNRYPSLKFHTSFIFYYSLFIGIGISYLLQKVPKMVGKVIFLFSVVLIMIVSYQFISGNIFNEQLGLESTKKAMDFNDDYKKMLVDFPNYIQDDTNALLFPLGFGYGSFILGENNSEVYRSTPTGFKNFTGVNLLGNLRVINSGIDSSIFRDAQRYYFNNNVHALANVAEKTNIKYLIYQKNLQQLKKYGEITADATYQNKNYYANVNKNEPVYQNAGYAVYKMKNYNDISEFTTNNKNTEIYFSKVSDFLYLAKIKTNNPDQIDLHQGFSKSWNIYKINEKYFNCENPKNYALTYPHIYECLHPNDNILGNLLLTQFLSLPRLSWLHTIKYGYYNTWKADTHTQYIYVAIVMDGQKYFIGGLFISLLILTAYIIVILRENIKKFQV